MRLSAPQPRAPVGRSEASPCRVPTPPLQGPFVHLSVMIAAYLGRVHTKAIGESEVRGSGTVPPWRNEREGRVGADSEPRTRDPPRTRASRTRCWWWQQQWAWPRCLQRPSVVRLCPSLAPRAPPTPLLRSTPLTPVRLRALEEVWADAGLGSHCSPWRAQPPQGGVEGAVETPQGHIRQTWAGDPAPLCDLG